MSTLIILIVPALVLIGTAVAVLLPAGKSSMANPGIHGFSEVLYAFFLGLQQQRQRLRRAQREHAFYNTSLGSLPLRALLARRARARPRRVSRAEELVPPGLGTLATHTPLFVVLLVGTVILVAP